VRSVVLFWVLLTLAVACAGSALVLRLFGLLTAAKIAVAATVLMTVLTVGSIGLGEWRYHRCLDDLDRACPDTCPDDYNGPFFPDCKRMRAFG
jgi:hypothetical protein